MSVTIGGLSIPFLEIEGVSERQEWYANSLRETYVNQHYKRFEELDEAMCVECDRRILEPNEFDFVPESMGEEYSEAEKACLFSSNAGGIISTLKDALYGKGAKR